MLISHEVPKSLLNESLDFNTYDYCLAHLLRDTESLYYKFYTTPRNRILYLDNSAFELGASIDMDEMQNAIKLVNPTHYFIPDVVNSMKESLEHFVKWMSNYSHTINPTIKRIQALQGNSLAEVLEHYHNIQKDVDMVGVSYDYSFFKGSRADGRHEVVATLIDKYPLIKIHLLGCQSPVEFQNYEYPWNVISVDTSHPVMSAFDGSDYERNINYKSPRKLADNLSWIPTDNQYKLMMKNITFFRKLINHV